MNFEKQHENPFQVRISFHKVIEALEEIAQSDVDYRSHYAKGLLTEVAKVPELRTGITDYGVIKEHQQLIRILLSDVFPTALSKNEIKAVTIPFQNITFNYSERFQGILNGAGPDFDMTIKIKDFDEHSFYVLSCSLILNAYYGYGFDFLKPLFYEIPDEVGITRYYRILYNADFLEIAPTENAIAVTPEEVDLLMNSYDDLSLWKEKFPADSWILSGFGIVSLFETTVESAISNLKTDLLGGDAASDLLPYNFQSTFRSIFKIPDLRVGFTAFNAEEEVFSKPHFSEHIQSFILTNGKQADCKSVLCGVSFDKILGEKKYFAFSDIKKTLESDSNHQLAAQLLRHDIKSAILAPVIKNNKLLGILELASSIPKALNSLNANKLDIVMPYLSDRIDRYYSDIRNEIDAIIQKEYTAIHPSVYWKFRNEAMMHTSDKSAREFPFREIVFREVTPLYGQIDIKGSSTARNEAIVADLATQIDLLSALFSEIANRINFPTEQNIVALAHLKKALSGVLKADTEAVVQQYILNEIHPILSRIRNTDYNIEYAIANYFDSLDKKMMMIYRARKDFDDSLSIINKKMAAILDEKQEVAQVFFPHYYERFKTDGVEHNLYIGASIAPKLPYKPMYLNELRLWQFRAMCEMENEYFLLRKTLPYGLDVASLILVFSTPISIRFRMDEKRFDVDGTYNARYEVVKKRIDKSNIRGTEERITQAGKITIVYSQQQEEAEYRKYISMLQLEDKLASEVESFDVEDLQGVTGLKALRVTVVYAEKNASSGDYLYEQLTGELND